MTLQALPVLEPQRDLAIGGTAQNMVTPGPSPFPPSWGAPPLHSIYHTHPGPESVTVDVYIGPQGWKSPKETISPAASRLTDGCPQAWRWLGALPKDWG